MATVMIPKKKKKKKVQKKGSKSPRFNLQKAEVENLKPASMRIDFNKDRRQEPCQFGLSHHKIACMQFSKDIAIMAKLANLPISKLPMDLLKLCCWMTNRVQISLLLRNLLS